MVISGTMFLILQVEPWDPLFCIVKPKYFWTETPGGLATLSLLAITGLVASGLLTGYLTYRLFFKQASYVNMLSSPENPLGVSYSASLENFPNSRSL